jgi:3-oxoadipate enol-lactonase
MPFVKLGDLDFYYERKGQGAPLLFISGTGGDLRNKPSFVDGPLSQAFDVLAYDQRGLGQTAKPDVPYTMADYADDAARLMDAMGWKSARVMGLSFGGMVAQEFVLRHPAKVERLVLACTSSGGAGGASYPLETVMHLKGEERARRMTALINTSHDDAWIKTHPEEYALITKMMGQDPFAHEPGREMGMRRQLEARVGHDTWARLPEIKCPVMIAAGKYDGIAPPANQDRMAAQIPGATLQYFEGGHVFVFEDPTAYPTIIKFLGTA